MCAEIRISRAVLTRANNFIDISKSRFIDVPDQVTVAFMCRRPPTDKPQSCCGNIIGAIIDHVARMSTPNFEHCQFIFTFGDVVEGNTFAHVTYDTTAAMPCEFTARDYIKFQWVMVELNLTEQQRRALYEWACRTKVPFNNTGFLWNFLPFVPSWCAYDARGSSYFCAELIAAGIKTIAPEKYPGPAYLATPDSIHAALHKDLAVRVESMFGNGAVRTRAADVQWIPLDSQFASFRV